MSENKTHWKKLQNPDYLGAYVLEPGESLVVTIDHVVTEEVTNPEGKKSVEAVMYFSKPKGTKPMVLNVTNSKSISKLLDSPYVEDWAGREITLVSARVKAFGEVVDALRVHPKLPQKGKYKLTPDSPRWAGAVQSLRSGSVTIEKIKATVELSDEHEAILIAQSSQEVD